MVVATELSLNILCQALRSAGIPSDQGLRISTEGPWVTVHPDSPNPDDLVVNANGVPVLIVAPREQDSIGDFLVDVGVCSDEALVIIVRKPVREACDASGQLPATGPKAGISNEGRTRCGDPDWMHSNSQRGWAERSRR